MKRFTLMLALLVIGGIITDKSAIAQEHEHATASSKSEQAKEQSKEVYTCPMHADVVSDKPGKCPKCGMKLQKVAVTDQKPEIGKTVTKMESEMGMATFDNIVDGFHVQVWVITQAKHKRLMSSIMKDSAMSAHMKEGGMMGMDHSKMGMGAKAGTEGADRSMMMAGTHHVMAKVFAEKTGKVVGEGHVMVSVTAPSGKSSTVHLTEMMGHFGGGASLTEKGTYKFALSYKSGAKSHDVQFEHEVK